jgi:hypothetical protein
VVTPRRWTTRKIAQNGMAANFDISADGRSVIAVLPLADEEPHDNNMIVVTNALSRTGELCRSSCADLLRRWQLPEFCRNCWQGPSMPAPPQ